MEYTRVVRDEQGLISGAVKERIPSFVDDLTGDEIPLGGARFLVSRGALAQEGPIRMTHGEPFRSLQEAEAHCRELEGKALAAGESLPKLTICAIPPEVRFELQRPTPAIAGRELRAAAPAQPQLGFGFRGSTEMP